MIPDLETAEQFPEEVTPGDAGHQHDQLAGKQFLLLAQLLAVVRLVEGLQPRADLFTFFGGDDFGRRRASGLSSRHRIV